MILYYNADFEAEYLGNSGMIIASAATRQVSSVIRSTVISVPKRSYISDITLRLHWSVILSALLLYGKLLMKTRLSH